MLQPHRLGGTQRAMHAKMGRVHSAPAACNHLALQARMLDLLGWRVRLDLQSGAKRGCGGIGPVKMADSRPTSLKDESPLVKGGLGRHPTHRLPHPAWPPRAEVAPCLQLLFQASPRQAPSPTPPPIIAPSKQPSPSTLGEHLLRPCTPDCEEAPRRRAAPASATASATAWPHAEPWPAASPGPALCATQQVVAAEMQAMCGTIRWQVGCVAGRKRGMHLGRQRERPWCSQVAEPPVVFSGP